MAMVFEPGYETPLLHALHSKTVPDSNVILRLVLNTPNLNKLSQLGESALHIAGRKNLTNVAWILLEAGASVHVGAGEEFRNKTPLHFASYHSKATEIIQALLKFGADVNARDDLNVTPLHEAAFHDCVENIEELVKHGARVNAVNNDGATPLVTCLLKDSPDLATVQALVRAGADVNLANNRGRAPLHYAAACELPEITRYLIKKKAKVNVCDNFSATPLHRAAMNRECPAEIIRELVQGGAMVNALDKDGQSPLLIAIVECNVEAARELLRFGATFNLLECLELAQYIRRYANEMKAISRELVRHAFINNVGDLTNIRQQLQQPGVITLLRKCTTLYWCNLVLFKDSCLREVKRLSKIRCDCGNSSMWGSLMGYPECDCDKMRAILKFLLSGTRSHFRDAFFYKLSKDFLLEVALHQISFLEFETSGRRVMLNWPCVNDMERYVSFEDLVSFLQRKESVMTASKFNKFWSYMEVELPHKSPSEGSTPSPKRLRVS